MSENESPQPRRLSYAAMLEQAHEREMAMLTKAPRSGSETVEVGQATVGDLKGQYHLKSAVFVRREDEDWPQFLGRIEQSTAELDTALIRHNAEQLQRQLLASTTRPKAVK